MSKLLFAALAAIVAAAAVASATRGQPAQTSVKPIPLPPSATFPVAAKTIDGWVTAGNEEEMRGHAWGLWALMNGDSGQIYNGKALPIWETWPDFDDIFTGQGPVVFSAHVGLKSIHDFRTPIQFSGRGGRGPQALDAAEDNRLKAFNKFDPEIATYIKTQQPGPGAAAYFYGSGDSIAKLNAAWPSGTLPQARTVNEFPIRAIEMKPIVQVVKATGLSVLPLWQGPSKSTRPKNPTEDTWTTCVIVDPKAVGDIGPATPQQIASAKTLASPACATFLYGSVNLLYWFRLTDRDALAFSGAAAGDYGVLVGIHVNTKEITNWTWQTFWWQPGGDTPDEFPGSKAGQPAGLAVPFNNYAMCTAYSQTLKSGAMRVCFNPYIETPSSIPAGLSSNCMSCHGVARVGDDQHFPPNYKQPIAFFTDLSYFNDKTMHTDFSWAIPSAP